MPKEERMHINWQQSIITEAAPHTLKPIELNPYWHFYYTQQEGSSKGYIWWSMRFNHPDSFMYAWMLAVGVFCNRELAAAFSERQKWSTEAMIHDSDKPSPFFERWEFADQTGAERIYSKPITQLEFLITTPTRLDKPGNFYTLPLCALAINEEFYVSAKSC